LKTLLFIGCIILVATQAYAAQAEVCDPVMVGDPPYRRLFLDAMVVEESANLSRTFHSAEKHVGNPVIEKDRPWEGWGPYLYGTVLRDGDKFRMWYQTLSLERGDVLYAESSDGINWTKPELGIIAYEGSKKNNIVASANACHIPSVIPAPKPSSPDKRWMMFGYARSGGASVAYSPDGLRWNWDRKPEQQHLFATSDVINFFFDPYLNRYAATYKTTNRRHRAVGVAVSKDGLKWTKPVEHAVFGADDLDPDATQVYGMPVFPYQGMYIGLPWIYHARWIKYGRYRSPKVMFEAQVGSPQTVDVQFAWSWNLLSWTRPPDRKPFIALGPEGAFDSKMIYTARAPIIVGDKLFFYYGGFDAHHEDHDNWDGGIGLATLRLDGFCSMRADSEEGWLVSRREVFNTPRVTINARCKPGGYVVADIVDRNDSVIKGFSRRECTPFTGDSCRTELAWKTASFPKDLIDKDRKIRFYIRNADLYSYLPADINQQIDDSKPDH
jgi:hypothetical protein